MANGLRLSLCWLLVLYLLLRAAAQTGSPSCASLNELIANTNGDELNCRRQESCNGAECDVVDRQFRFLLQLIRLTLSPCANGTPTVLLELLGAMDVVTDRRSVVFSGELRNDTAVPLEFNGVPFGTIIVTYSLQEGQESIGFALQRYDASAMETTPMINHTTLILDFSLCPTTASPTTGMPTSTLSSPMTITEPSSSSGPPPTNTHVTSTTTFTDTSYSELSTIARGSTLMSNFVLVLMCTLVSLLTLRTSC